MRVQNSKRFLKFGSSTLWVLIISSVLLSGCRSGMRNQRETALLRAEILDLEDQYYALKARCEAAEKQLSDAGYDVPLFESEGYIEEEIIEDAPYYEGDVIYDDYHIVEEPWVEPPVRNSTSQTNSYMRTERFQRQLQSSFSPSSSGRPVLFPRLAAWLGIRDSNATVEYETSSLPLPVSSAAPRRRLATPTPNRPVDDIPELVIEDPELDSNIVINDPNDNFDTDPLGRLERSGELDDVDIKVPFIPKGGSAVDIVINTRLTRGEDIDGMPGDEGLVLLLQPQSSSGQTVTDHGQLTVSLIDPKKKGSSQRVGLWKFTPAELRLFTADGDPSAKGEPGYLLHLPWDRTTPESRQLELFVRYKTSEGRMLETRNSITITPPGRGYSADSPLVSGWTQRSPDWGLESTPQGQSATANSAPFKQPTMPKTAKRKVPAKPASTSSRPQWRPNR